MTKKISQKINQSSLQVLKTLQVLLEDSYTMNEIVNILNDKEDTFVFNNSVISKYINTCRFCGMDIPKIQNKYYVAKIPFGMDLTNEEAELIEFLQDTAHQEMTKKQYSEFDDFVEKINRYSNKRIAHVQKEEFHASIEIFERAIFDKRKIKLLLKNQAEIIGIPVKIIDANNKTFFHMFCNGRDRMFDINRLSGIQEINDRFIHTFSDTSTIFVLKGKLAKRYSPRENETITINPDNTVTVVNRGENKDILLSRLLRYDNQCEIVTPKSYRRDFRQIIDDTLKNYGVA